MYFLIGICYVLFLCYHERAAIRQFANESSDKSLAAFAITLIGVLHVAFWPVFIMYSIVKRMVK